MHAHTYYQFRFIAQISLLLAKYENISRLLITFMPRIPQYTGALGKLCFKITMKLKLQYKAGVAHRSESAISLQSKEIKSEPTLYTRFLVTITRCSYATKRRR